MTAKEGTREWYMHQLHDAKRTIGAVWEAMPDDLISSYEDPAEAIKGVLELRDQQIANLTARLAEAKAHAADLDRAMEPLMQQTRTIEADISAARVEGYSLGRNSTLDRIEVALGKSSEPESFTRGIVATLRASLTWRDR